MFLDIEAFQIDDRALMTVRERGAGGKMVLSGAFRTRRLSPGLMEIYFELRDSGGVDNDAVGMARIASVCDDPKIIGKPCEPGQVRFRWTGELMISK